MGGVAPATMHVIPAYFCRKKEEKYNQKKALAVWCCIYLPTPTWNLSDSQAIDTGLATLLHLLIQQ